MKLFYREKLTHKLFVDTRFLLLLAQPFTGLRLALLMVLIGPLSRD